MSEMYVSLNNAAHSAVEGFKPGIVTYNASDSSSFPLGNRKNKGVVIPYFQS